MLWYKGWLETRSRLVFALVWSSGFLFLFSGGVDHISRQTDWPDAGVKVLSTLALVWTFIPLFLAGTGIKTQSGLGARATKGVHGSSDFTLSLPVTRARLIAVRASVGLLETMGVIVVLFGAALLMFRGALADVTAADALPYLLTVFACTFGTYGLAVLVSAVLEEVWVIPIGTVVTIFLWVPQFAGIASQSFNLFRPMAEGSPLVTHTLPWTAMAASLAAGAACLLAALKVVQRQEY